MAERRADGRSAADGAGRLGRGPARVTRASADGGRRTGRAVLRAAPWAAFSLVVALSWLVGLLGTALADVAAVDHGEAAHTWIAPTMLMPAFLRDLVPVAAPGAVIAGTTAIVAGRLLAGPSTGRSASGAALASERSAGLRIATAWLVVVLAAGAGGAFVGAATTTAWGVRELTESISGVVSAHCSWALVWGWAPAIAATAAFEALALLPAGDPRGEPSPSPTAGGAPRRSGRPSGTMPGSAAGTAEGAGERRTPGVLGGIRRFARACAPFIAVGLALVVIAAFVGWQDAGSGG